MLGKIPLVSISDKRLGGIENSSLRYFSAILALECSTSRIVSPSFSRRVRRLLPAGSIETTLLRSRNHTKGKPKCGRILGKKSAHVPVTNYEHGKTLARRGNSDIPQLRACKSPAN